MTTAIGIPPLLGEVVYVYRALGLSILEYDMGIGDLCHALIAYVARQPCCRAAVQR